MTQGRRAGAGVVAAGVALGVTELAAGVLPRTPSLLDAVAVVVIDVVPHAVVSIAVSVFGTSDKVALLIGAVLVSLLLGTAASLRSARSPGVMTATLAAAATVGVAASLRDPSTWLPVAVLAGALGALAGRRAHRALTDDEPSRAGPTVTAAGAPDTVAEDAPPHRNRREFIVLATALGVGGGAAGLGGRRLGRTGKAAAARARIALPAVASPLPAAASGTSLAVPGISPLLTPTGRFFRIDTALVPPDVDPATWRLNVTGMVDRPFALTYDELLTMPMEEADVTIACVSNEVGGDLIGTARWQGVPLRDLLDRAGVQRGADQIMGRSVDSFTAGFPTAALADDRTALVAVAMNGEPLPVRHGFPARLVIAGLYGYVSATKWLSQIELTTFRSSKGYWIKRGWAAEAPVKVAARIDVPRGGQRVVAGPVTVAGLAWAPTRGIGSVEVRIDDGPWRRAELADALGDEAWRQWRLDWAATPGRHRLRVRATDGEGRRQIERRHEPFPDGATGYHEVTIKVGRP